MTLSRTVITCLLTVVLAACGPSTRTATPDAHVAAAPPSAAPAARDAINPRLLRRFRPIARLSDETPAPTAAQVSLGRMLYFDARLSSTHTVSCATCHALDRYGVDGAATSTGVLGRHGRRNAPTVYNAADHIAQFWDGRAPDERAQASGPMLNPLEMGATRASVESTLRASAGYRAAFAAAFPRDRQPVTLDRASYAIAAFERGLVTRSRWDDYLAGDASALTPAEVHGLRVFLDVGCVGCHTGPQVGASMFQVVGFVEPWPRQADQGRWETTHVETDRMVFKVPSLKNIARTSPYFHDGSCATLPEAVRLMGRHQLGVELGDEDVAAIVAFFGALTGELPREYIARPTLPEEEALP